MIKFKFIYSLKSRIIIIIVTGSILIVSSMTVYFLSLIKIQKNKDNKKELVAESEKNTQQLYEEINTFIKISQTIAFTFEQFEQIPENFRRLSFESTIKNNLKGNEDILALWTKFKPFTIDKLDTIYQNKVLGTSGQFFKCFYRNKSEILEKEVEYVDEANFDLQEYITVFQNNKKAYIQAPLLNFYNESYIDTTYIISIVSPVFYDRKFIGVVGIDLNLKQLIEKYNSNNYTLFFIDENSNIVFNSNKKLINKNFNYIYPEIYSKYNIVYNLSEGISTYIREKSYDEEIYSQLIISPIFFKDASQTFALAQKYADKEVNQSFRNILIFTIAISLIFIIITFFLSLFISNILEDILVSFKLLLENVAKGIFNISNDKYKKFTSNELKDIVINIESMTSSLSKLENFADEIKEGNLSAEYTPLSKKDKIGYSLLALKENINTTLKNQEKRQQEDNISKWLSQGVANFGDILRKNLGNLENLSFETISQLVRYLEAMQGGIFLYNDDDPQNIFLELTALFAYDRQRFINKNIQIGEGIIGTCALEKKMIHLKKIPENYIEITSGLGKAKPNTALIIPLIYNNQIYGVMEIAKLEDFKTYEIEFAEKIAENIASTLASSKISSQTTILLEKANLKYEQLLVKEKELGKNFDHLQDEYNKIQELEKDKSNIINTLNEISLYAEFDTNFKLIKINSNLLRFLKQTYDEALSKNYYEVFNIELENFDEHSRRLSNLKVGLKQEFIFNLLVAGEKLYLKCVFNPIYDNDRRINRFLLFAFDHTQFIKKESEIKKLIEETQLRAEQIEIQEMEMVNTFEELNQAKEETNMQKEDKNRLLREIDRHEKRIEFYKRELEKRIDRFKKIETNLKDKVKSLEEHIKKLEK